MKMSKNTWKIILKVIVTVATAIAGVLGVKAMTSVKGKPGYPNAIRCDALG